METELLPPPLVGDGKEKDEFGKNGRRNQGKRESCCCKKNVNVIHINTVIIFSTQNIIHQIIYIHTYIYTHTISYMIFYTFFYTTLRTPSCSYGNIYIYNSCSLFILPLASLMAHYDQETLDGLYSFIP